MNQTILLESKTARNGAIQEVTNERMDDVFHKVKGLVLLPDDMHVTVEMVANYYEVDKELIKYHIKENSDELISDGLKVLKGSELKDFKAQVVELPDLKFAPSLTIIPRRAILRIGMLLRDSEIAKQVRTYLLNVESNASHNDKLLALSQEHKIELIDLKNDIKFLAMKAELQDTINMTIVTKIEELLNQPLFKIHENMSSKYEILLIEFQNVMSDLGIKDKYNNRYNLFNNAFGNWTGHIFKSDKINKKQFWLSIYGLENIEPFIVGVKQGIIVQNKNGNWVSKSGVYTNKVEWRKVLTEFNNECAYCGDDTLLMAEHIIPQTDEKSSDIIYNILTSCRSCNQDKGVKSIAEFYNKSHKGYTKDRKDKIKSHWNKYKI